MVSPGKVIRADNIALPHGFLDGSQSDAHALSLAVPRTDPVFVQQVHSARAIAVSSPYAHEERPEADAMATRTPGLALAIVTADCAPILFADHEAGVIGAAHAGWRGAQSGVVEAAIVEMEQLGAQRARIAAAIGPCIAQENYEVGADMRANFAPGDHRFFEPTGPGKWHFDLEGMVAARLASAGIDSICALETDTYSASRRFHSYRRATHRGEPTTGRQVSLIALSA
ncbi:peptidoglycan editing factor PgeF [Aurantiacibacter poecillastricola]|uniref:peptidoglycan editing factor PgeF n=1 Tax=Aurantiacibacter poecillastricola TaxID=3064385 RepID=UPI00274010B2|nr:peptidoglycan editing factor PgeF [Aurantiacibacter sp. 219JJ12-13]MDP5260415.1 peptidoglycan editing factor PgeF [Aurantiacibacter sp. 219JJ12-13]